MIHRVLIAVLALGLSGPALAQNKAQLNESEQNMLGPWEFSNADRDKICTATFKSARTGVGYKVEFDPTCASQYPLIASVAGWKYPDNDLLYLLDSGGRSLITFSEVEDGMFEAPTPGVGVLFLQNPAAAGQPPKTPDEVAGQWAIKRGDGPVLCILTLADEPVKDGLGLTVQPGCNAAIAKLGFTQWRMDRGGELLLVPARGAVWRFEATEDSVWTRVPGGADQITLVRR